MVDWQVIIEKHGPAVWQTSYRLLGNHADAANIRSLKPDESVILTVTGSAEVTGTIITASRLTGGNQIIISERVADGKMITKVATVSALNNIGLSSPAILVIRTKKSDINEFAKGDLDFDKFRQRVQLLTCPYLGGAAERVEAL